MHSNCFVIKFLLVGLSISAFYSCTAQLSSYADLEPKTALDRFEDEIVAYEDFDRRARYHKDLVIFTGSSSVRLWTSLHQDMSPLHTANRGFGGSTLPEVIHYFDRLIGKLRPKIVVLYCGENDLAIGYTAEEVFTSYLEFVRLCKERIPNTRLIYMSMKPSPARWDLWHQYVEANTLIQQHAEKHNWIGFCDISNVMLEENGAPNGEIYLEDNLHLNEKGYQLWTRLVKPFLIRAIEADSP